MAICFEKLSQHNALTIANEWKYDGIYSFYDMTADLEDYEEFVDETVRDQHDHYQAVENDQLIGFFCVILEDSAIEIGLGLRPDLCGKGIGKKFVDHIVNFIQQTYQYEKLVMNVVAFNQRAVKVYRSCGFQEVKMIKQRSNGGIYDFLVMEKDEKR